MHRLFNPYPAKADCDGLFLIHKELIYLFSTHIQRKRIATISPKLAVAGKVSFQPISSESGLRLSNDKGHDIVIY